MGSKGSLTAHNGLMGMEVPPKFCTTCPAISGIAILVSRKAGQALRWQRAKDQLTAKKKMNKEIKKTSRLQRSANQISLKRPADLEHR